MEEFWFKFATNIGMPGVALAAVGYAIFKLSSKAFDLFEKEGLPRIDKMIDRHVVFLDTVSSKLNKIEDKQVVHGRYIKSTHKKIVGDKKESE